MHYSMRLLSHIKRAERATQAAKESVLRAAASTPAQHTALAVLSDNPGITSAELARLAGVTPQTMTSLIGRLEAQGLVERSPHPVHGTLIEIRLTQRGKDVFTAADALVTELDARLTAAAGLTANELATLKDLLNRVSDAAT